MDTSTPDTQCSIRTAVEDRFNAANGSKTATPGGLSRLPANVTALDLKGRKLEDILRTTKRNRLELYAVRWNIEIGFRAWKQSGHLAEALARRSNIFHLQVLMLAGILLLILILKITRLLQGSRRELDFSIEKIADHLVGC